MGRSCLKQKHLIDASPPFPAPPASSTGSALITAVAHAGTVIFASYVNLHAGASGQGTRARACTAWHWLNMKGRCFPAVCAGGSHWSADDSGAVVVWETQRMLAGVATLRHGRPVRSLALDGQSWGISDLV